MLTQERLKELLDYNPETGVFVWKVTLSHRAVKGSVAGNIKTNGYCQIQIDKKLYKSHRLAWLYAKGCFPQKHLDHIDRNPTNNAISNLREVTVSENQWNVTKRKDNTSGYLGVFNQRNKWKAQIRVKGLVKYLGTFDTKEQAHTAYVKAKEELHKIGEQQ